VGFSPARWQLNVRLNVKAASYCLLFLSSPIASKHSAFPLTEVSASEVPAILKKFVSREATSEAATLKLSRQPGRVYVTSFRLIQNWRKGEKPATDLASLTRSAKSFFFPSDYPLHHLQCYHFTTNLAQEQPQPKVIVKRLLGSHLDKTLSDGMTSRKRGLAVEYCSKWRQRNDIWILGFFGDEFHKENLHFRLRLRLRWMAKLGARFLLVLTKKNTFFGVTFSFKLFNC